MPAFLIGCKKYNVFIKHTIYAPPHGEKRIPVRPAPIALTTASVTSSTNRALFGIDPP